MQVAASVRLISVILLLSFIVESVLSCGGGGGGGGGMGGGGGGDDDMAMRARRRRVAATRRNNARLVAATAKKVSQAAAAAPARAPNKNTVINNINVAVNDHKQELQQERPQKLHLGSQILEDILRNRHQQPAYQQVQHYQPAPYQQPIQQQYVSRPTCYGPNCAYAPQPQPMASNQYQQPAYYPNEMVDDGDSGELYDYPNGPAAYEAPSAATNDGYYYPQVAAPRPAQPARRVVSPIYGGR